MEKSGGRVRRIWESGGGWVVVVCGFRASYYLGTI